MEADPANYQVVLPTNKKLKGTSSEAAPNAQFLVGYRNVLAEKDGSVSWGLSKSQAHCGRAFVFQITQTEGLALQQIKEADDIIERVGNSFIFLKANPEAIKPKAKISLQVVKKLLEQLGGTSKINLNILKNAFNSLQEYRSIVDEDIQRELKEEELNKELDPIDKVKIEINSKTLSGVNLRKLPLILKQSGDWSQTETVQMKALEH